MKHSIELQRHYPYPPERVWQAIATSEALSVWLMPTNFEARKGHQFYFQTKPQPGFDGKVQCEVLDVDPPYLLQYSWQGGPMKVPTTVTFRLQKTDTGTLLLFTQTGFEGLLNRLIVRFILEQGWKKLLYQKLNGHLKT